MTADAEAIVDAVFKLGREDQMAILSQLLRAIPVDDDLMCIDDDDFFEEIERRANDGSPGIPWEEVKRQL